MVAVREAEPTAGMKSHPLLRDDELLPDTQFARVFEGIGTHHCLHGNAVAGGNPAKGIPGLYGVCGGRRREGGFRGTGRRWCFGGIGGSSEGGAYRCGRCCLQCLQYPGSRPVVDALPRRRGEEY